MFDAKLDMDPIGEMLRVRGLHDGGRVQQVIDSECMRLMGPYMPRRQAGELEHMMVMATIVGSGQIDTPGPYAHYLHEGIVYVDPKYHCAGFQSTKAESYGEWFSRRNVVKVPTDRELQYTGAPMRGKKWFDRMKGDHKDEILEAAQRAADGGKV